MRRFGFALALLCVLVFSGCHRSHRNDYTVINTTVTNPPGQNDPPGNSNGHGHSGDDNDDHGKGKGKNKGDKDKD